ncbi:hypothetical protein D0863_06400 [Hortaea werneckii]|uniref:U3 small nucleolar RNA-associated protein 25 n=1 Tax=Hortaea werneckii TaxID=91943 RepID=A0A3M7DYM9_HORWE|nr:hypothetical protein D0863_06400 [Hortaea werneckii]
MAPNRGRGGPRGGFRGGRGNARGRGGAAQGSGKLARSGIRTKAGYRKFDSQRVKDVDSQSEDEMPDAGEQSAEEISQDDMSDSEEDEEVAPSVKAYNALLQSFKQPDGDGDEERRRKRRKVEKEAPRIEEKVPEDSSVGSDEEIGSAEEDGGLEVDEGASEDEDEDEEDDMPQDDEVDAGAITRAGEGNDEDEEDASDPYEAHFANIDENDLSQRLKSIQGGEWRTEKQPFPKVGSFTLYSPQSCQESIIRKPNIKASSDLVLKKRVADNAARLLPQFDETQRSIAPYLFNYTDLLYPSRTPANASSLRSAACVHALNHVLKGRDKILKNSARLASTENPETLDLRDQGFTRPKVLILTETRQHAYYYGSRIADFFAPEQVENKQRFHDSFTAPIEDNDNSNLPEDYRELFDGNNDNSFLTAIKFTRKTMKYFSAFYTSDIILASPLGLRRIIENEDKKKQDWDFLSSIEVLILDQVDAMQMQSAENIEVVMRHLNLQPRSAHGTDFNRVRPFYLDNHARHFRQTILFTAYLTPETNRLFNTSMQNLASGKAKLTPTYPGGAITAPSLSGLGVKQTFSRFPAPTPSSDPDARFKYFTTAVLPTLLRLPNTTSPDNTSSKGILLYIPSYFDFLRLRNYFATATQTQHISFGTIHDYSSVPDQRRARAHFLSGRTAFLLYTQRAHHFFRQLARQVQGVKRVCFYGIPDPPAFYEEVVGGMLGRSLADGRVSPEEAKVRALFSRFDGLRLERVVGSQRVKGLVAGKGDMFEFV